MAQRIQLRRDTAANWASVDPVLAQGEPGLDLDADRIKFGDGVSAWSALEFSTLSTADVEAIVAAAVALRLLAPANLSDVANASTALSNLGLTANGKSLVTAADYAAMRTLLGLVVGTDVQAFDADLAAIAALATTPYGRDLLTLANAAALAAAHNHDGTYLPGSVIGQVTTTAGQTAVTFDPVPQTFHSLSVVWFAKGETNTGSLLVRCNNISTATYDGVLSVRRSSTGAGSPTQAEGATGMEMVAAVGTSGGRGIIDIPGYTDSFTRKSAMGTCTLFSTSSPFFEDRRGSGENRSTDPITRLDILPNFGGGFAAGSTFTLIGVG